LKMRWIKDEEFIRGSIPMTKFEIRLITVGLLEIEKGDVLLDIGAGTGSVSIEAALQGAKVTAIEREEEGVELIRKNSEKFGTEIEIIQGAAPKDMDKLTAFNKCFIGGSGGSLRGIVQEVSKRLSIGGIVAANFVTLNNFSEFQSLLREYGYKNIETRLVQSSVVDEKTGILRAQNPVFIVRGIKV
jgi:cobalt-precorrin-6B (C15)-methyltransferase